MAYKSIVVALAGAQDEESVIRESVRLSVVMGAKLRAMHVNNPTAGHTPMMMEAEPLVTEDDIREQFRRLGYADQADKVDVDIRTSHSLAKEISNSCEGADLLIIGHRQKHRFLSALTDAADKHLADRVSCPVLIVPRSRI